MKTLIKIQCIAALFLLPPVAAASIYEGTWTNTTFHTSGATTIDIHLSKTAATGNIDFDGPVFGGGDPPAIPFNIPLKPNGSGKIVVLGTPLGDVRGSISGDGDFHITLTNIPGGFLTEVRLNGLFDIGIEKFTATYEIDNAGGLFAEGVVDTHVHKAPAVKLAKMVAVKNSKGKTKATVITNTGIKSVVATVISGKAKVSVKGKGPYQITAKKLKIGTTKIRFTVTNDDGFKKSKVVKFVRKSK